MLPSILGVATQHGLKMNERTSKSTKDVRFKCPFCQANDQRNDKFYLSLNTRDNVFKCWACGESGGVLQFMALLENISIEEVKRRLWGSQKAPRRLHPAEKLTPAQLRAIGFVGPGWAKLKKQDYTYYRRALQLVWREWQQHVWQVKRLAYMRFLEADTSEQISAICRDCAREIGETPENLLLEFTSAKFAGNKKPDWAKSAEDFITSAGKPVSPDGIPQAG